MAKIRVSMAFEELVGAMQGGSLRRAQSGIVAVRPMRYRRHVSPKMQSSMDRLAVATAAWSALDADGAAAWRAYGAGLKRRDPVSGTEYAVLGHNAFTGLATKFLQLNPGAPVPLAPPAGSFEGDAISVTVASAPGGVAWRASGAQSSGVTTELLIQRLASVRCAPGKRYSHGGFAVFDAAPYERFLALEEGAYALATQFVETATGRVAGFMTLGVVDVRDAGD